MIGRGMVADPGLALALARRDAGDASAGQTPGQAVAWPVIVGLMRLFWLDISQRVAARHRAGRLKQWLNYMRRVYPEAQEAFDQLRLMHDAPRIAQWLAQQDAT